MKVDETIYYKLCDLCAQSDSVIPWTVVCQAVLSMGFPRQGY